MKLRPHQVEKSYELASILSNFNIAYLAGEDEGEDYDKVEKFIEQFEDSVKNYFN